MLLEDILGEGNVVEGKEVFFFWGNFVVGVGIEGVIGRGVVVIRLFVIFDDIVGGDLDNIFLLFNIFKLLVIGGVVFWLIFFSILNNLGIVFVLVLIWFKFWRFGLLFLIGLVIEVKVFRFVFNFLGFWEFFLKFDFDLLVEVLSWGMFKLNIDFLEVILELLKFLDRGVESMGLESRLNLFFFLVVV